MLTSEELKEIRERAEKATPGPWRWADDKLHAPQEVLMEALLCNWEDAYVDVGKADAAFIATARSDIPALLDTVEDLRELLQWAKNTILVYVPGTTPPVVNKIEEVLT